MSWELDPYGIPLSTLFQRAYGFENGKLRSLSPKRRAIVTALELLQTDLIPRGGKETLFLTTSEYAQRYQEVDFANPHLAKAEEYLRSIGLMRTVTLDALKSKAKLLGQLLADDVIAKQKTRMR